MAVIADHTYIIFRDVRQLFKQSKPILKKQAYRTAFKLISAAAWIGTSAMYKKALTSDSEGQFSRVGIVLPVAAASLNLLTDFFVIKMELVGHIVSLATKVWRVLLGMSIYIVTSQSTLISSSEELHIQEDRVATFFWLFTMQSVFMCLFIYFTSKKIE